MKSIKLLAFTVFVLCAACGTEETAQLKNSTQQNQVQVEFSPGDDIPAIAYLKHNEIYNPESVIPAQCYTKTDGDKNPCYVCHQSYQDDKRPNYVRDGKLQGAYDFSDEGMRNSWKNLFKDRSQQIEKISDIEVREWVNTDNYTKFIDKLKSDQNWKGEIADLKQLPYPDKAFESDGFAKDGSHWVAYNYKPLPSSFWPTNGSTGDAMIRLPEQFRTLAGKYNKQVYQANLALLEMSLKDLQEVSVSPVSEILIDRDLDGNGELESSVYRIVRQQTFVGDASQIPLEHMLYPQGTEFLHTVRYVGVNDDGSVFNAPRMKEVRYMKKAKLKSAAALKSSYYVEAKEKHLGQLPRTVTIGNRGIDNGFGWVLNAYIEDEYGELRQQNKQELAFCNGCHKTIGSTIDQTFSFARKLEGSSGWGYIDLKKILDVPNVGSDEGEFLTYFKRVKGGDEFRQNQEMLKRWFTSDDEVNEEAVKNVTSIYELITPSAERARKMNKAYKLIVDEQSYIFGRDVVLAPAVNVLTEVDAQTEPLEKEFRHEWDIRLDWMNEQNTDARISLVD